MKPKLKVVLWLLFISLLLYACGGGDASESMDFGAAMDAEAPMEPEFEEESMTEEIAVEVDGDFADDGAAANESPSVAATPAATAGAPSEADQSQQRLIIKDGRITTVVDDTERAVNQATDLAVELGGYIISQNMHDDTQGYRYATMRLAVLVDQFEFAMQALRGLGQVTNESASGVDVTDEFVDLNSRVTNLELTRDRLRSFLDEAENVTETLAVNEELKAVEEEIAVIQGRINFLRDRAAFSTIDLTINPWIPTPTPTATPTMTPTPTATPIPTAETWRPVDTVKTAAVELQDTAQDTADFAIYYGITCLPWLVVLVLVGYPFWRLGRRFRRSREEAQSEEPALRDVTELAEGNDEQE